MYARVPVPWGAAPKAQTVSGLTRSNWHTFDRQETKPADFDDLFEAPPHITTLDKSPATALALPSRSLVVELPPEIVKWAVGRGIVKADPQRLWRPQIAVLPSPKARWTDPLPPTLMAWAVQRGIKRGQESRTVPRDPFATVSKVLAVYPDTTIGAERLLPPSLLAWAVDRGVVRKKPEEWDRLDPFSTRSQVISLQRRKVYAALTRGEWCHIDDLEFLPWRLREWLRGRCRLIRYVGGGRVSGTPANGYVTEDGTVFYVAEDGSTFYVQE